MSSAVMKMFVSLGMDDSEFNKGLSDSESKASSAGSKIGSALAAGAKVAIAGFAAATAAVTALTKSAVSNFAEYEQLIGGIETMFEDLSWDVEQNANKAFQTAGISANAYMETVMGFSASLNQSLMANEGNIARAAEASDQIIVDMADNANKMGTSMESIQTAYSGFAKQNFTMLDNLKLGYGGTKEEMERLMKDAAELKGYNIDEFVDVNNFANVAEAIHIVQEEMGIAGTTAREATTTIEGSLNATKAAWDNLVTGFANPDADLGQLITNVVDSAKTAFGNLMPVIKQSLSGISQFIGEIAPILGAELPSIVNSVLPSLVKAATDLFKSLAQALPQIIKVLTAEIPTVLVEVTNAIMNELPTLMQCLVDVFAELATGISEALPELIPAIVDALIEVTVVLLDNIDILIDGIAQLFVGLSAGIIQALPILIERLPEILMGIVNALIDSAPILITAVDDVLNMIRTSITDFGGHAIASMGEWLGNLVTNVGEGMSNMFNTFVEWLSQLPETLAYWAGYAIASFINFVVTLPSQVANIFTNVMNRVKEFGRNFANNARQSASNFFNNIVNGIRNLPSRMAQFGSNLVGAVSNLPNKFLEIGSNIVQGIWKGISGGWSWLIGQVKSLATSLFDGAKDALGIHSPSKKFAWIGQMIDEGMAGGIEKYSPLVTDAMEDITTVPDVEFGSYSGGLGNGYGVYSPNVTINITGVEGKTARELADIIDERMAEKVNRSNAVWA